MSENDDIETLTADTGRELELTTAELAEVNAARAPAAVPAETPVDEPAPPETAAPPESDIRTLAAAATQAAQAATAAAQEMAAARQQAAAPVAEPQEPQEPDWAAERAQLKAKYDAGEIDEDQYENAREELIERKADFNADKRVNEVVNKRLAQQQAQDADRQWDSALSAFNADAVNATFTTDPIRSAAFRAVLDQVAKEKPAASYVDWLNTTRDRVAAAFGVKVPTAATGADIQKAQAQRANARQPPQPDLTRAPSAGMSRDGDGYANLDSLPIGDLEDRLAALNAKNPGAIDAFLADAPGGLRDNPRSLD